ncbi:MAG: hypothetical protein ACRD25_04800 [Terracidiphilus sp.]
MDRFERLFRNRMYATAGCGGCALMALSWAFVKGALPQREFVVAGLIWWIFMFAAFFLLVKSRQRSAEELRRGRIAKGTLPEVLERDRYIKSIRSLKRAVAVFAALLIYGIWATQGAPALTRAVGAGFDALIVASCVYAVIRLRKRLKALSEDGAKGSSETD